MSPMKLFTVMKCQEARRLLYESSLTIQEIEESLGFKTAAHFSTVFKKIEGYPPLEVRKQMK